MSGVGGGVSGDNAVVVRVVRGALAAGVCECTGVGTGCRAAGVGTSCRTAGVGTGCRAVGVGVVSGWHK